jgi:hypothetical protein
MRYAIYYAKLPHPEIIKDLSLFIRKDSFYCEIKIFVQTTFPQFLNESMASKVINSAITKYKKIIVIF